MLQIDGLDEVRRAGARYDRARSDYSKREITGAQLDAARAAYEAAVKKMEEAHRAGK